MPEALAEETLAILEPLSQERWQGVGGRHGAVVSAVMGADRTGAAVDRLHEDLSDRSRLLVLVRPLDAVLPRPLASTQREDRAQARTAAAVSREEVYANIEGGARLDVTYLALVVLASIVAAVGLARDNTAAVIGAMVVAPLLGPNMAIALGMVLGDGGLVRRALTTGGVGLVLAWLCAAGLGLALAADPSTPELAARTRVELADMALALAAGCAGALSYTTGAPTFLTGVMVAVALLPPAVASGILFAVGAPAGSLAALLLAGANITALTLAAMLTFLWRGMRPRNWWLEAQARRSARIGVAVFVVLFAALAALTVVARGVLSG